MNIIIIISKWCPDLSGGSENGYIIIVCVCRVCLADLILKRNWHLEELMIPIREKLVFLSGKA